MMIHGCCWSCRAPLAYNATYVPSIRIEGKREPLCRVCVETANPKRKANGLPLCVIHPEAYEPEQVA